MLLTRDSETAQSLIIVKLLDQQIKRNVSANFYFSRVSLFFNLFYVTNDYLPSCLTFAFRKLLLFFRITYLSCIFYYVVARTPIIVLLFSCERKNSLIRWPLVVNASVSSATAYIVLKSLNKLPEY